MRRLPGFLIPDELYFRLLKIQEETHKKRATVLREALTLYADRYAMETLRDTAGD